MRKFRNSPAAAELGITVAPRYLMHARPIEEDPSTLEPCCIVCCTDLACGTTIPDLGIVAALPVASTDAHDGSRHDDLTSHHLARHRPSLAQARHDHKPGKVGMGFLPRYLVALIATVPGNTGRNRYQDIITT